MFTLILIFHITTELAYTIKVTEKCDVYSFGVLALEVIKGKHPKDHIDDLISMPTENTQLMNLLDERLVYPTPQVEKVLESIVEIAKTCLTADSHSRPTMQVISNFLSKALHRLGKLQCVQFSISFQSCLLYLFMCFI